MDARLLQPSRPIVAHRARGRRPGRYYGGRAGARRSRHEPRALTHGLGGAPIDGPAPVFVDGLVGVAPQCAAARTLEWRISRRRPRTAAAGAGDITHLLMLPGNAAASWSMSILGGRGGSPSLAARMVDVARPPWRRRSSDCSIGQVAALRHDRSTDGLAITALSYALARRRWRQPAPWDAGHLPRRRRRSPAPGTKIMACRPATAHCSRSVRDSRPGRSSDTLAHLAATVRILLPGTEWSGPAARRARPRSHHGGAIRGGAGRARSAHRIDRRRRCAAGRRGRSQGRSGPVAGGGGGRCTARNGAAAIATKSRRDISTRKIGTPTTAVNAPTGSCRGASNTREPRSAAISRTPPSSADAEARHGCRRPGRAARGGDETDTMLPAARPRNPSASN